MTHLRLQSIAAGIAFAITGLYAIDPGPYQMAAFVFFAQPLYLIALLSYMYRVWSDLRSREVI